MTATLERPDLEYAWCSTSFILLLFKYEHTSLFNHPFLSLYHDHSYSVSDREGRYRPFDSDVRHITTVRISAKFGAYCISCYSKLCRRM